MMNQNTRYLIKTLLFVFVSVFLQSCFTGVEGTSKITLSKKEMSVVAPSAEDRYLDGIEGAALKEWKEGKRFIVSDEKIMLLLEGASKSKLSAGDTIRFAGAESRHGVGGGERTVIKFEKDRAVYEYPLEKPVEEALSRQISTDLPMLIDLDVVEAVRGRLMGKTFWTRSSSWYDNNFEYKKGRKYKGVRITDVQPGNAFFPLLVCFTDEDGETGRFLINAGTNGNESRNFGRMFFIENPKNKYRHITAEHWNAIQKEEVTVGMTKEEVRLSRGYPTDVETGHNYSNAMEIWIYPDGSFVRFIDGLVVNYK